MNDRLETVEEPILTGCFGLCCASNERSVRTIFIVKGMDNGSNKNALDG